MSQRVFYDWLICYLEPQSEAGGDDPETVGV